MAVIAPSFFNFVYDFNGDGWPDVLEIMAFGSPSDFLRALVH